MNLYSEGRLWIHAASKVPDEATIKAMEDFYREIYAVDGIADLKFPEYYPVSRLLGIPSLVLFVMHVPCVHKFGDVKINQITGKKG